MKILSASGIVASALTAQQQRMNVSARNIANAESTRTAQGGPYRRERVVFAPVRAADAPGLRRTLSPRSDQGGVAVQRVQQDPSPPVRVHDPAHPDADPEGYVAYPNVNLVTEMTNLVSASRAYEAALTLQSVGKSMTRSALDIGRR
jgi:flagellar basal-body rod protein FlgC